MENMESHKNDTENLRDVDPEALRVAKRILENTINAKDKGDLTDEYCEVAKKFLSGLEDSENRTNS